MFNKATFIFLFCWPFYLGAQGLTFPKLSLFEGTDRLKSPEWFGLYEDRKGYLWMGSNLGLLRFNGQQVQNYVLPFETQHVFEAVEDSTGRLWFLCFTNGLCYLDQQNKLIVPAWNKSLQRYLKKSWVRYLHLDSGGTLHLLVEQLDTKPPFLWLQIEPQDTILQVGNLAQAQAHLASTSPQDRLFFQRLVVLLSSDRYSFQADVLTENQFLTKSGHYLRWYLNGLVWDSLRLDEAPVRFFVLDSQTVFVRGSKTAYWLSLEGGRMQYQKLVTFPKSIYVAQGRFWLVDWHEDLWFYPSFKGLKQRLLAPLFPQKTQGLVSDGQQLWAMNQNGFFELKNRDLKPPFRLSHAQWQGDLCYWRGLFFNGFYRWTAAEGWLGLSELKVHDNIKQLRPMTWEGQPVLGLCLPKGLMILDSLFRPKLDLKTYGFEAWTMAVWDGTQTLWLGTLEGLWRYDKRTKALRTVPTAPESPKLQIIDLVQDPHSPYLALATLNQGLWLYDEQHNHWLRFDPQQAQCPLNHYKVNCILPDGPNRFWIGTPNGLNRLEYNPQHQNWNIAYAQEGLDVQQILQTADALYVLGTDSLWRQQPLNPAAFRKSKPLPFQFAAGQDTILLSKVRNLTLRFDYIQLFPHPAPRFAYRLYPLGQNPSNWNFTTEAAIVFSELSPGFYRFDLSTEASLAQDNPLIFSRFIQVEAHYWEQTWFSALVLLLVALLSAYFVWWISHIRRRNLERKAHFLRLQLQLLNNQMNPHFLFNTLNAIQGYLALGDIWIGLDYIAVFASLLRNQLNQSLKTIIPLSEELQTLRYYIELEKIRLGPDYVFSYEAPNDEALQAYSIPPMTLQPLVENAIAHGVSPNGKGLIRIVVHLTDRALTVMVEDNGIGRKAALSKQNKEKQYGQMTKSSLALKNLQQRLLLLQQLEGLAVSLQMEDLQDEQGQAKGTRVVLRWS